MNEQFHQLAVLSKGYLGEALLHLLTESFNGRRSRDWSRSSSACRRWRYCPSGIAPT